MPSQFLLEKSDVSQIYSANHKEYVSEYHMISVALVTLKAFCLESFKFIPHRMIFGDGFPKRLTQIFRSFPQEAGR